MRYTSFIKFVFVFLAVMTLSQGALAQTSPALRLLSISKPSTTAAASRDPLGRETPKGMIRGFLNAVAEENYEQAASYLDLGNFSPARQKSQGPDLAKDLQTLLDQGGGVESVNKLSDNPEGNQNDALPPKIDLVGTVRAGAQFVDLLAERSNDKDNGPVWLISKTTVDSIPVLLHELSVGPLDRVLPKALIDNKWYGVPLGHWAAILVIAAISLFPAWLLTFGVIRAIRAASPIFHGLHARHVLDALVLPIRIYIGLGIFVILARIVGISIVARQHFILVAEVAAWLSLWWLLWRIIDDVGQIVQDRMTKEKKRHVLSSVMFFRRTARFILAGMAIALTMDRMGVNVTAWFAALGIGGLALAFGAQKTLENFVVGLTLIIDQPLRIGDFCRIGDIKGTVEDIGMRSTRLRTPDRTLVIIPNGTLATITVENYSHRKNYWFHPTLALKHATTPDQLRKLLKELQEFLTAHPLVQKEPLHVRLLEFGKNSLNIEVYAYVSASNYEKFLQIQEELLLRIMETVKANGIEFSTSS